MMIWLPAFLLGLCVYLLYLDRAFQLEVVQLVSPKSLQFENSTSVVHTSIFLVAIYLQSQKDTGRFNIRDFAKKK